MLKKLLNLLETYNLVQHITEPTHRIQHLLDYIISDAELVSAGVSDFVSDHCALHASLVCTRSHPKRKQITFRQLKTIDHDLLFADIGKINFNLDSKNVDSIVDNYNTVFTSLLDKHAPLKTDYVVPRDVQPWMTEEIMSAIREKHKEERIWRKSRLEVHLQMFIALCLILKNLIQGEKEQLKKNSDCGGDQKKLFGIVNSLLGRGKKALLPQHDDSLTLARLFNEFFITKIDNIRQEFLILEQDLPFLSSIHFNAILDVNSLSYLF